MGQKEWERQEAQEGQEAHEQEEKVKLYYCRLAGLPATNSLTDFPHSGVTEVGQQTRKYILLLYPIIYFLPYGIQSTIC